MIQFSQDLSHCNTDSLFATWREAKKRFIDAIGDLIYEYPTTITFELDEHAKEQRLNEFLDLVCRDYGEDIWAFLRDHADGIWANKLTEEYNGYPRGMKLSKVLMKEFGAQAEPVRQKLSMLIQSNKISGKLCLSVHPLDFLSASENTHAWRSCHALDGEYRTGNLSYMTDTCTVMAYLKSVNGNTKLPRFPADVPWNDKKWRCYFYVDNSNQLIYAGRQYPFHSDAALGFVAEIFNHFTYFDKAYARECKEIMESDWPYFKAVPMKPFKHWGIRGETNINGELYDFGSTKVIVGLGTDRKIVPITKYVSTNRDATCYNDLIDSHCYAPYIMAYNWEVDYMPEHVHDKLVVGAPCMCVACGKRVVSDSDNFLCAECQDEPEEYESDDIFDQEPLCQRCGAHLTSGMTYWRDGWGTLCEHCADYIDRFHGETTPFSFGTF